MQFSIEACVTDYKLIKEQCILAEKLDYGAFYGESFRN
jgi:hypothetical protein